MNKTDVRAQFNGLMKEEIMSCESCRVEMYKFFHQVMCGKIVKIKFDGTHILITE